MLSTSCASPPFFLFALAPAAGVLPLSSGAASGVTEPGSSGAAVSPRWPGVSSMPRNCVTALLISAVVVVTNEGPSWPSKWTSFTGASRASMNSFSTSSMSAALSMSEVVCSVKMSISSLRSAKMTSGGTFWRASRRKSCWRAARTTSLSVWR